MSESLRMRVVEAGTDEFRACMAEDELLNQIPVRILDAMLDCLAENADEWGQAACIDIAGDMWNLLEVLREDR